MVGQTQPTLYSRPQGQKDYAMQTCNLRTTADAMRDANAHGDRRSYYQLEAQLKSLVVEAQRAGHAVTFAQLAAKTDPAGHADWSNIPEALGGALKAASSRKAQEPAATRLVVYSEEIDNKLEWLNDLAAIEACTLLIEKTADVALRTQLDLNRAGAINRLKQGTFSQYVAVLAEQVRKETAAVESGRAQKAVELYQAIRAGGDTNGLRKAYGQAVLWLLAGALPEPARKSARAKIEAEAVKDFAARSLATRADWEARLAAKDASPMTRRFLHNGYEAKIF